MEPTDDELAHIPVLPSRVPVEMPQLPPQRRITTVEQLRAISDPLRLRILGIIQNQPATAKQIAERLEATPGAIGHHLGLLEAAGLAQVVARRLVRGVVAKYYTRTARIFDYDLPPEVAGTTTINLDILRSALNELGETAPELANTRPQVVGFPHVRMSAERARAYEQRLEAFIHELLAEPHDAAGEVYGVCIALFLAPNYLQASPHEKEAQ